ncbi:MAG: hypothetical protein LBU20_01820 [Candidatus Nomurabacteria bacterium]|jgi:hypothetical protein|nr:hypothetical protein [Candidatus Nomurabacteria bacterium]
MDGMKLDEQYRQKNGLGPAAPEPNAAPKEPVHKRLTFNSATVEQVEPAHQAAAVDKPEIVVGNSPPAVGFIDKVLSESGAPKVKKVKSPEPLKTPKIPKPKPASKHKLPAKPQVAPIAAPKVAQKPVLKPKPPKKPKTANQSDLTTQLFAIGKIVLFVSVIIFSLYNYIEVRRLNDLLDTEVGQQSQNDTKNKELINTISAFRLLPDSEYEVYTVKDKTKLVNDPVFERAENGDKVVVYPSDSLTIVYRESEGKIVGESKNSALTEKNDK